MCTCSCVWIVVWTQLCTQLCLEGQRSTFGIFLSHFSTLIFEPKSLTEAEVHQLTRLPGQQALRICLAPTTARPSFLMWELRIWTLVCRLGWKACNQRCHLLRPSNISFSSGIFIWFFIVVLFSALFSYLSEMQALFIILI